MNELYVTTVRAGLDYRQVKKQPYTGGLFRLTTNVQGVPTYKFSG